ncbi:MAG: sn-glycerol-3-phosphate ABC transporter ATP-binding protein UgpC [Lachnospiraceae bacterium]|nr:sn-glycerol-3-phosphate ABC transporter ATP-binding protein UgpC [Lachnospiraceae bacterium]MCI9623803.1 sn-glycerol-3-phosphate ABC transporter ATP-binding protein UgpC [Lachnospiraceae bacterium]
MATVKLNNINKIYENGVQAVFDFNLDIKDKEFIVFVGPSGCGKTTTLRMIAGLEDITSGELWIDQELVNRVEAKNRNIAMVFQNYALYPHMSVYQNLSFSLENKKVDKETIDKKVREAAAVLGIEAYLDRKPKALSGGQRQRVALGRAIVRDAKVFLMDEPLSNLDAKLRVQMRTELIRLHKSIGATTIYVTHDQTEAMTMADRIVVMNNGYVQQVGTPEEIYENPANLFVAGFLGSPQINFFEGRYEKDAFVMENGVRVSLQKEQQEVLEKHANTELVLGVRPEDIHLETARETFDYQVEVKEMLGHEYVLYGNIGGADCTLRTSLNAFGRGEEKLRIGFDMNKCHVFDKKTEERIF